MAWPAAHVGMSQSWVPAVPGGQSTTQTEPASHVVWHGPLWQAKWQTLFGPHEQSPLAHTPSHVGFDPVHATWHGGAPHENSHSAPSSQVHVPLAHVPVQADPLPQSTWQGGAAHPSSQEVPAGHRHVPFEQSLAPPELHATTAASAPKRSAHPSRVKRLAITRSLATHPPVPPPPPPKPPVPPPPSPRHTLKPDPKMGMHSSPLGHSLVVEQSCNPPPGPMHDGWQLAPAPPRPRPMQHTSPPVQFAALVHDRPRPPMHVPVGTQLSLTPAFDGDTQHSCVESHVAIPHSTGGGAPLLEVLPLPLLVPMPPLLVPLLELTPTPLLALTPLLAPTPLLADVPLVAVPVPLLVVKTPDELVALADALELVPPSSDEPPSSPPSTSPVSSTVRPPHEARTANPHKRKDCESFMTTPVPQDGCTISARKARTKSLRDAIGSKTEDLPTSGRKAPLSAIIIAWSSGAPPDSERTIGRRDAPHRGRAPGAMQRWGSRSRDAPQGAGCVASSGAGVGRHDARGERSAHGRRGDRRRGGRVGGPQGAAEKERRMRGGSASPRGVGIARTR